MSNHIRFGGHFDGSTPSAIAESVDHHGVGAFQFFLGDTNAYYPAIWNPEMVEDFKHSLDGVTKVVHLPYIFNFATPKDQIWNMSVRGLRSFIKQAQRLGVDYLVVHPGSYKESSLDEGNKRFLLAVEKVKEEFEKNSKLVVCFENTAGGGTTIGKLDNLCGLIKNVADPRFSLCLDTAHLYAEGVSFQDIWPPAIQSMVPHPPKIVHFNNPDPNVTLGGHLDRHEVGIGGEGKYDLYVMQRIFESFKDAVLIVEGSHDYSRDFKIIQSWCKQLAAA